MFTAALKDYLRKETSGNALGVDLPLQSVLAADHRMRFDSAVTLAGKGFDSPRAGPLHYLKANMYTIVPIMKGGL